LISFISNSFTVHGVVI